MSYEEVETDGRGNADATGENFRALIDSGDADEGTVAIERDEKGVHLETSLYKGDVEIGALVTLSEEQADEVARILQGDIDD